MEERDLDEMTDEEIEAELDACEGTPLSDERIRQMVRYATDPDYRALQEKWFAQWQETERLKAEVAALKAKLPQGPRVRITEGTCKGKHGVRIRNLEEVAWVWLDEDYAKGCAACVLLPEQYEVITNEGATS